MTLDTNRLGGLRQRQLVVIVRRGLKLRTTVKGLDFSEAAEEAQSLSQFVRSQGFAMRPLFGENEQHLQDEAESLMAFTSRHIPDLSVFYRVDTSDDHLDQLAKDFLNFRETVEAAYVKPPLRLPRAPGTEINPLTNETPITENYTDRQGYLCAAPAGIDAVYGWGFPGGTGKGVKIIDIESAWRFSHEDLSRNQGGLVGGHSPEGRNARNDRNHGTAVLGVIRGEKNGFGVTGICPESSVRAVSVNGFNFGSGPAIRQAANMLDPGDIILIELHGAGPRYDFQDRDDLLGFIPLEFWEDDFVAIQFATAKGVIVVEAGGNGSENLDDELYDMIPDGFPKTWKNPFRRKNRDSGAVLVGAGAPPSGRYGLDRSRLTFSNYGSIIDAQGWGEEVTTCGDGKLQGGIDEDRWYTDDFNGTSSASPIVVGALGCIQGILRAARKRPLVPIEARELLRSMGSEQQDSAGDRAENERIGYRPDLRKLIPEALKAVEGK